ncbi:MAG TPA: ThiF family adenylyltransferase [Trebonia sp.]|nr:ThiF family adenylyltransferase [Trebonia sp.]
MRPDEFYRQFTARNEGLVPGPVQEALRVTPILVAGCGSTGGAAIEPLARLGAERFILAEPGRYDLTNLNRQRAAVADVGHNKAEVAARWLAQVNPHARAEVHATGIAPDAPGRPGNALALVRGAGAVIDGVDVTTAGGWRAKYALHAAAATARRPVVSGYDLGGTQHVRYYDYPAGCPPLAGQVTEADVAAAARDGGALWPLLLRVVPRAVIPADLIADVRAGQGRPDYSAPQLAYTAQLFGVLAARYVVQILAGHPVRPHLTIDVHKLVRPEGDTP